MSTPSIIVVPLTLSEASQDTLRLALAQARAATMTGQATELHLLHVQPRLSRHAGRFVGQREQVAAAQATAAPMLASALEQAERQGLVARTAIRIGDAATQIADYAQSVDAAKIVMATSRASQFTRLLRGSVSARLSAMSRVPVEIHATRAAGWDDRLAPAAGVGVGMGLLWAAVT